MYITNHRPGKIKAKKEVTVIVARELQKTPLKSPTPRLITDLRIYYN